MNGDVYNDYNVPYVDRFPNLETLLIVEGYLAETTTWIEPRNSLTQWISSMDSMMDPNLVIQKNRNK